MTGASASRQIAGGDDYAVGPVGIEHTAREPERCRRVEVGERDREAGFFQLDLDGTAARPGVGSSDRRVPSPLVGHRRSATSSGHLDRHRDWAAAGIVLQYSTPLAAEALAIGQCTCGAEGDRSDHHSQSLHGVSPRN